MEPSIRIWVNQEIQQHELFEMVYSAWKQRKGKPVHSLGFLIWSALRKRNIKRASEEMFATFLCTTSQMANQASHGQKGNERNAKNQENDSPKYMSITQLVYEVIFNQTLKRTKKH